MRHQLSWMDDHIPSSMLSVLVGMARESDPALGVHRIPDATGDDAHDADVVQTHLSNLLNGHDEEVSRAALAALADADMLIDAVALDMLRTTGMDAAVMMHLAWIVHARLEHSDAPTFRLTEGPARRTSALVKPLAGGRVFATAPLVEGTHWVYNDPDHPGTSAIVMNRPLPNNVMLALEGRRLPSVVQHPVLDPLDLVIRRAFIPIGAQTTRIEVDLVERPVAPADVGYEGTRPDRRTLVVHEPPRQRAIPGPTF